MWSGYHKPLKAQRGNIRQNIMNSNIIGNIMISAQQGQTGPSSCTAGYIWRLKMKTTKTTDGATADVVGGNAKECENRNKPAANHLAGKDGSRPVDDCLSKLAASIREYAESHKSSDSGWVQVKSSAAGVHNGLSSDIPRLIRDLGDIKGEDAKGFSVELSVLLGARKLPVAEPKTVVTRMATDNDNLGVEHKCEDSDARSNAGSNAGATGHTAVTEISTPRCFSVEIGKLQPHPRANGKFKIDDKEFAALKANMSEIGFDPRHPVIVVSDGKGGYLVVDGMSRLRAAQELGKKDVFIMLTEFESDEAVDYFIATTQLLRRDFTDAVLMTVAAIIIPIEERRAKARQGTRSDLPTTSTHKKVEVSILSSDAVGLILHRSGSTVDKIKKILANPEYSAKVMADEIKITPAYREIMAAQRTLKPAKTDKQANAGLDAKANGVQETIADENSEMATPAYGARIDTVEPDDQNIAKQNEDIPADVKAPVADPACSLQRCGGAPKEPETQSDGISAGTKRLLVAIASNVIETAKAGIRELLADCDPGIAAVVRQCLEDNTETGHHRVQSKKNSATELTFRKGNSNQQQRKENVKADTLTGKHK